MFSDRKKCLSTLLVLAIIITLCFIWGNSMQSREVSSNVSNGPLELINKYLALIGIVLKDDHFIRKLAHFCEFAVLGIEVYFLAALHVKKLNNRILASLCLCLLVAAIDETIQYFSGRACRFSDVMLDFSGSICAVVGVRSLNNVIVKRLNNSR